MAGPLLSSPRVLMLGYDGTVAVYPDPSITTATRRVDPSDDPRRSGLHLDTCPGSDDDDDAMMKTLFSW